jgi:hypothetical protein
MGAVFAGLAFALVATTLVTGVSASGGHSDYQQPELSFQADTSGRGDSAQSLQLPINLQRNLGDLDGMLKRHQIRALVVPSRSGFFYDRGNPHGIFYEAFNDFPTLRE